MKVASLCNSNTLATGNIQLYFHFSYNFNLILKLTFHQIYFLLIYISPSLHFHPKGFRPDVRDSKGTTLNQPKFSKFPFIKLRILSTKEVLDDFVVLNKKIVRNCIPILPSVKNTRTCRYFLSIWLKSFICRSQIYEFKI